jgi:hypothetical protein
LNGGQPFRPETIEMIYWFAGFPDRPERFSATSTLLESTHQDLLALVGEIETRQAGSFEKTLQEGRCRFCVFRSLCERGSTAGLLSERADDEEPGEIEINFDQIGEIRF